MFQAIMKVDENGGVTKYASFATKAEAAAHVGKFIREYPNAFVSDSPKGTVFDWKVSGKQVVHAPGHQESVHRDASITLEERIARLEAKVANLEGPA